MEIPNPNQLTASGSNADLGSQPEFVTSAGAEQRYGICKSHLYTLKDEGKIKSVCIRKRGAARGKRLWSCDSIRAFLLVNMEGAGI
jgi:hypothetical protein